MKEVLVFIFFISFWQVGTALRCYTCSIGEQDIDTSCVTDAPHSATVTNCNKKYCTTIRQEYKDPKDKVASMFRGCEDDPDHMNEIIEDATYRFYYTACQVELCNGGTGKASDGGSKTGNLGDKSTIYAPGIGNGCTFVKISVLLILLMTITHYFV